MYFVAACHLVGEPTDRESARLEARKERGAALAGTKWLEKTARAGRWDLLPI